MCILVLAYILFLFVSVRMLECMCVRTYACVYVFKRTCFFLLVSLYICLSVCVSARILVYMCVSVFAFLSLCVCLSACVSLVKFLCVWV